MAAAVKSLVAALLVLAVSGAFYVPTCTEYTNAACTEGAGAAVRRGDEVFDDEFCYPYEPALSTGFQVACDNGVTKWQDYNTYMCGSDTDGDAYTCDGNEAPFRACTCEEYTPTPPPTKNPVTEAPTQAPSKPPPKTVEVTTYRGAACTGSVVGTVTYKYADTDCWVRRQWTCDDSKAWKKFYSNDECTGDVDTDKTEEHAIGCETDDSGFDPVYIKYVCRDTIATDLVVAADDIDVVCKTWTAKTDCTPADTPDGADSTSMFHYKSQCSTTNSNTARSTNAQCLADGSISNYYYKSEDCTGTASLTQENVGVAKPLCVVDGAGSQKCPCKGGKVLDTSGGDADGDSADGDSAATVPPPALALTLAAVAAWLA